MTPERAAALVAGWVRFYTRNLPTTMAERRVDEIDADLHDHIEHERTNGTDDGRIALGIAARMIRGMAADVSWRGACTRTEARKMSKHATRSVLRVALVTGLVLLLPLVGMLVSDEVNWSLPDFVFAAALLTGTGLLLELAAKKRANLAYGAAAAAVGVAAIALGEADDAPGLVLFGLLVITGTVGLRVRTARR